MKIPRKYNKELQAMKLANTYKLLDEYKLARRKGYSIDESLAEWDLGTLDLEPCEDCPKSTIIFVGSRK